MPSLRSPRVRTRLANPAAPPVETTALSWYPTTTAALRPSSPPGKGLHRASDTGAVTLWDGAAWCDVGTDLAALLTTEGDVLMRLGGVPARATRAQVVGGGLVAITTGSPAGTAVLGDGAGNIALSSADVSAMLAAANNAAIRAALAVYSKAEVDAALVAAAGGATLGHSWERPAPGAVPAGAVFICVDDLAEQVSSGLAVSPGVAATGWMQRLASGLGSGRAGLGGAPARAYADSIDLSAYTIDSISLAALWTWDGTQPATYGLSEVVTFGDRDNESRGIHLAYVTNGANTDLAVYTGGAATVLVPSANLLAGANGPHALSLAAVNVGGTHKWRFSYDGSAVADVAMTNPYVAPSNADSIGVGARPDGLIYLKGRFVDLMMWNSTLSNAALLALATLPGTPTYELPESASTGAAAIRVQACRYDPAYALALPARGVGKPLTVAPSTVKVGL